MTSYDTPRIYVASLSDYVAGRRHGVWVDATDIDEINDAIESMLAESKEDIAEEWAIHDTDGFCGLSVDENEDLEKVAMAGKLLEEHGPAFAAWLSDVVCDLRYLDDNAEDSFQDSYRGEYDSERAYAEYMADEGAFGEIPDSLQYYIDYDAMARDLFCGDHVSVDNPAGGVFVFTRY